MSRFEPQQLCCHRVLHNRSLLQLSFARYWSVSEMQQLCNLDSPFSSFFFIMLTPFFASPKSIPSVQSQTCHPRTPQLTRKKTIPINRDFHSVQLPTPWAQHPSSNVENWAVMLQGYNGGNASRRKGKPQKVPTAHLGPKFPRNFCHEHVPQG